MRSCCRLAAAGKLHDPEVLRGQVRRMMRDPRARGLAEGFAVQWLGVSPLGVIIRPDSKLFPEFNDELAAAMREETILFFDSIVREDRSVLDIIDADFTFVNERLAALYKIEGIKGPEMRRVQLDDPVRGGVLGQASILTVTSHPHRTSPVLRGRWVLQELLGADVPSSAAQRAGPDREGQGRQAPAAPPAAGKTPLQGRVCDLPQAHGSARFRPGELRPAGPLAHAAQMANPSTPWACCRRREKFDGPMELKKLLLDKRRPEFLRNLCRKMLGYALGREINNVDMCVVQDCVQALEQGDFRVSRLLETIVVSYPFTHRYHKN